MSTPAVLDACALIAWSRDENGAETVDVLLKDRTTPKMVHAVNLVEVRYDVTRVEGRECAETLIADLVDGGVTVRRDLDDEFCASVADLKSRGRVSLADCICIALSVRVGGEVWTSDRAEFQALHDAGACRAVFIR